MPFAFTAIWHETGFIQDALSDYRAAGQVDNMRLYLLNVEANGT